MSSPSELLSDPDYNRFVGLLSIQTDLIDSQQFASAYKEYLENGHPSLGAICLRHNWITDSEKSAIEQLAIAKLERYDGSIQSALSVMPTHAVLPADDLKKTDSPDEAAESGGTPTNSHHASDERYASFSLHATGGIGRIRVAQDRQLGRKVAIKDLLPEWSSNLDLQRRFLKEAKITGQLEHPGIVPVYELSSSGDGSPPFYAMRFVKGQTLLEAIREYHHLPVDDAKDSLRLIDLLNAFVAVCNTVAYAHSRGVIHRDLKGQNIILGEFGEVIVLDWGIAKLTDEIEEQPAPLEAKKDFVADETLPGIALGTPGYMAPEQMQGLNFPIDHRADIYGLGAILYEILAGQPPFAGEDIDSLIDRMLNDDPEPPGQLAAQVPRNLEFMCLRALAKNPDHRYDSALEMADGVRRWQESQRQEALDALKESEALYHGLVEALPMVVWRKDTEGRFTFISPGWTDLFGWASEDIVGKTDFDIMPAELAEKYLRDDQQILQTGEGLELEEETTISDGRIIHIRAFKMPVRNASHAIIGTQGFLWDDSEHKRLQETLLKTQQNLDECRKGNT